MARLPFLTREDLPESERHIYEQAAGSRGDKKIGRNFEALMSSPEATARVMAVGTYLRFQSELPANIRELVTITTAREMAADISDDIEWISHVQLARKAGVSEASITAIETGKAPAGLPQDEANIVAYTLEILRTHRVKDETFDTLHKQLGTKNLVDLTLIIGYYSLLSIAFHAIDLKYSEMGRK